MRVNTSFTLRSVVTWGSIDATSKRDMNDLLLGPLTSRSATKEVLPAPSSSSLLSEEPLSRRDIFVRDNVRRRLSLFGEGGTGTLCKRLRAHTMAVGGSDADGRIVDSAILFHE